MYFVSPAKKLKLGLAGGAPNALKEVIMEIYNDVEFKLQSKDYTNASLALFMGKAMQKSRDDVDKDNALRCWSGLSARNPRTSSRLGSRSEGRNGPDVCIDI